MFNVNRLAAEAHENAEAHGFWAVDGVEDALVALMHAELSEAVQAERDGLPMETCEPVGAKPEGVAVELADFVIRLMDYAAGHGWAIPADPDPEPVEATLCQLVNRLHRDVVYIQLLRGMEERLDPERGGRAARMLRCEIAGAILRAEMFLEVRGIDLWRVVRAKMDYNRDRPRLHGKRY